MQFFGEEPNARNTELETAARALEFFQIETRGAPKITEAAIKDAIKRLGARAQQKEVARELNVTAQGLTSWRERNGLKRWQDVVARYAV